MCVTWMQMTVLMLMLAGSDTSKLSHKVLLGVLPDLPPAIIERVRALLMMQGGLLKSLTGFSSCLACTSLHMPTMQCLPRPDECSPACTAVQLRRVSQRRYKWRRGN